MCFLFVGTVLSGCGFACKQLQERICNCYTEHQTCIFHVVHHNSDCRTVKAALKCMILTAVHTQAWNFFKLYLGKEDVYRIFAPIPPVEKMEVEFEVDFHKSRPTDWSTVTARSMIAILKLKKVIEGLDCMHIC